MLIQEHKFNHYEVLEQINWALRLLRCALNQQKKAVSSPNTLTWEIYTRGMRKTGFQEKNNNTWWHNNNNNNKWNDDDKNIYIEGYVYAQKKKYTNT